MRGRLPSQPPSKAQIEKDREYKIELGLDPDSPGEVELYKGKPNRLRPVRPDKDIPVKRFYEGLDEGKFREALDGSGVDKWQNLASMMTNPGYAMFSFMNLCRRQGIALADLHEFWRNHQVQTGLIRQLNHLPDIMEEVAKDAKKTRVFCTRCDGLKRIVDSEDENGAPIERDCPACDGEGKVWSDGSKLLTHARDIVYESSGLTNQKGPAVIVPINITNTTEETSISIGKILEDKVIDV